MPDRATPSPTPIPVLIDTDPGIDDMLALLLALESPELKVKAFASVFGTDSDQTLIGIPAFQAPLMSIPVPEIAIFKWQKSRGQAELRLYEFDGKTDVITRAPPPSTGHAKLDKFTVLLFFGFTVADVDKHD